MKDSATTKSKPIENSKLTGHKKRRDGVSLFITNTFGSIVFLLAFAIFVIAWVCINLGFFDQITPFDPFPFQELQMVVSVFAIVLTISVLISQKRQARLEKIGQEVEFEVNIKSEMKITKVLEMLHSIQKEMGIADKDKELEQLKEHTDIEQLHKEAEE